MGDLCLAVLLRTLQKLMQVCMILILYQTREEMRVQVPSPQVEAAFGFIIAF